MIINEIYPSIQGESTYAGLPCLFIRLTGCNLRCNYCDTEYAFHEGKEMSVDDLITVVEQSGHDLIEITGGEPLLQNDVFELIDSLVLKNKTVLIETSGSVDIKPVNDKAIIIMDLKCPSSDMSAKNNWSNLDKLDSKTDELKFVIKNREDYDWVLKILSKTKINERIKTLFSPVHGELDPKILAEWILEDRLNVRLQVQIHKYIWGAEVKGV